MDQRGHLRPFRVRAPLRLLQLLRVAQEHDVPSGPARSQRMGK
jgi:hypothetical protein